MYARVSFPAEGIWEICDTSGALLSGKTKSESMRPGVLPELDC